MNYQTIIIAGVEYFLVPKSTTKNPDEEILSGYSIVDTSPPLVAPRVTVQEEDEGSVQVQESPVDQPIQSAEGKPSEHRKKFMDRTITPDEFNKGRGIPMTTVREFRDLDELEAEYKGDKLFYGEGLQIG